MKELNKNELVLLNKFCVYVLGPVFPENIPSNGPHLALSLFVLSRKALFSLKNKDFNLASIWL